MNMKPAVKRTMIVAGSVTGVLVVLAAVAPFIIDLNKYKDPVLAKVRPAVKRQVDFDTIRLTVLTGLGAEITGLKIPENPAFASDSFVSLESVQVKVKVLPLFTGKVRVAKLIFRTPVINVRRNAEGVFNFNDMIRKKEEEEKESKVPALLASFGISELAVKNGTFLYEDRRVSRNPEEPGGTSSAEEPGETDAGVKRLAVSGVDAEIRDISLTNAMAINLKGNLLGEAENNLEIAGTVGPIGLVPKKSDMPLALTVKMDSIPMKRLTEDLGLSYRAASGTLNGEISSSGTLKKKLVTSAAITLKDLVKQKKQGTAGQAGSVPCTLDFNGKIVYEAPGQDVTIEQSVLKANGSSFSLSGGVQRMKSSPALRFVLKSTSLETGSLAGIAPVLGADLPAGLNLKGPGGLEVSCAGVPRDLSLETRIDLTPAAITFGSRFNKTAGQTCTLVSSAGLKEGIFTISALDLLLYNLQLAGSGNIRLKGESPAMDLRFAAKPFALKGWGALIPLLNAYKLGGSLAMKAEITGGLKAPVLQGAISSQEMAFTLPADKKKQKSKETPSVLQGLDLTVRGGKQEKAFSAQGSLNIRSGRFGQIALSKLAGSFAYSRNQLSIPSFQMGIFNGNVNGAASYQAKLKDWTFSSQVKKVDAGQAMNTLTSFKDIFAGSLSGKVQARGNAAKKGLESLASQGLFTIEKGKINNLDIVKSTIDGISGIQGLSGIISTEQGAVKRNIETRFDSLNLEFSLLRKVLDVPSLKLVNIYTGKETNTMSTLKGSVDMASRKVDFNGDVAFSPDYSSRLVKRAPALSALVNNEKRVAIPIRITGPVNKPMLTPHTGEISHAVAQYYARKGVERVEKQLKKKLKLPENSTLPKGPVDDLLKGVFGK